MQNTIGISIFTGRLLRPLLGELAALDPHLVGLGPQHPADRHAEGVGLEDGQHEGPDLRHVGAGIEGSHGVGPAGTGAHLAEHPGELLGEGPGHGGDRAVERLLEAETGLDADHEEVQDVGQLRADRVLPLLHLPVEDGVGAQDEDQPRRAR